MKVCVVQSDILWEDKKENMARCEQLVITAAQHGADVIVFPELTLTGFTMDPSFAEDDMRTIRFFADLSEKHDIYCVFGYAEKSGSTIFNRLAVTDRDGKLLAAYSKLHPFSYGGESRVYSRGCELAVTEICGIKTGLSICYDLRFPELFQALSRECACIIVSANWPEKRIVHWHALLKARAIENQCFIIGCNRTGDGGGEKYCGGCQVISPEGDVIALSSSSSEQLLYADIEHKAVERVRRDFPLKNDRRPDLYKNFYET